MAKQLLLAWCYLFASYLVAHPTPPPSPGDSKPSLYRNLLKPVDIFSLPDQAQQTISLASFFDRLVADNLEIKRAHYDLGIARESNALVARLLRPQFGLSASSSLSQHYEDEQHLRAATSTAAFGVGGSTDWGISYEAHFPKLLQSKTVADERGLSQRVGQLGADAQVSFSLLRDSPFLLGGYKQKSAVFALASASQGYSAQVLKALYDGEQLYYDVFTGQAQVLIDEYTVKTLSALFAESQELYQHGEIAKFDLLQVELQLENSRSDLVASQNSFHLILERFREILNANELLYPDPRELATLPPEPTYEFATLYAAAMKTRPDLLKAEQELHQSSLTVAQSTNGLWPKLDLVANYGRSRTSESLSATLDQPFALRNPQTTFALVFTHDLSNYKAESIQQTNAMERLKRQITVDTTKNVIRTEITSALTTVQSAFKRYQSVLKAKNLSIQKLQAEFDRYRRGESSIKNVIDFQKEVNSAESADLRGRVAILQALATLRRVQGLSPKKAS